MALSHSATNNDVIIISRYLDHMNSHQGAISEDEEDGVQANFPGSHRHDSGMVGVGPTKCDYTVTATLNGICQNKLRLADLLSEIR